MKKFGSENARYYHSSGTEKAESSSYQDNELQCMELTLDINPDDGSVFVSDFKSFDPKNEDPGRSEKSMSSSAAGKKPQLSRSKARAEMVLTRLKFITKIDGVAADFPKVEKKFHELTEKSNGFLHRSKFGECIGMDSENPREMDSENPREPNEFALALFDALGRRVNVSGDSIDKDQMAEFWSHLTDESFDSRLQIFFDMVDKDEDGRLNEAEVREIISLSASANKLDNIKRKANEYAALIMEALDPFDYGYITIENLKLLLLQAPRETIRGVESEALSKMLSQKLKVPQSRNLGVRFCKGMKYFLLDNWKRVWVIALWICVMVGLFTWKFIEYRKGSAYQVMGVCVCMAKGAAETLKLNMAMILLPVCKNTITLLRTRTKLGAVVPFDDSLNLHKVIAIAISIGVGIHAITHLACDFPRLIAADEETYKPMEQYFGEQAKSYGHFLKSVEVLTGTGMIILMTIAFTLATAWFRKNKLKFPKPLEKILRKITGFNSFWYTHHLFVIVYSLLIVHGYFLYLTKTWYKKTTWMYLTVPMIIYLSERLIRALRSSIEPVSILKVGVLRGKALMLRMSRPTNFRYKSGQYMYLKCSQISSIEWHPFSITSAPGDDYLSVHIKVEGDWTGKLRSLFKEACEQHTRDENRLNRVDVNSIPNLPRILIDGPYGAPSQDYKNFEVVLLVGGGIGATPMISIVRDIINNIKDSGDEEAGRAKNMVSPRKSDMFRTKRAYFYWVTREQESFEWFKNVMDEVTEADSNKVIEMHSYCSSIYEEGDARSALITMLQSLHHEKHGVDVVSGTHLMSHFARPKWKSIYTRIAGNHPYSKVGVFYCGGANLAKELQHHALNFSHITSTKFCFHKENF